VIFNASQITGENNPPHTMINAPHFSNLRRSVKSSGIWEFEISNLGGSEHSDLMSALLLLAELLK
jgi:hypothetical protein